jgi:hypothetical protein
LGVRRTVRRESITLSGRLHMRGLKKVLLLAGVLAVVAGACGRAEQLTAPGERPPATDLAPHDDPPLPPDTTGRWGGGLGSGT